MLKLCNWTVVLGTFLATLPLSINAQNLENQSSGASWDVAGDRLIDEIAIKTPTQPFELNENEMQYLVQLLDYWQQSSEKVKQYVCQFQRFEFDSDTVNYRDPSDNRLAAATIARGEIRFAAPDRGYYETQRVWAFAAPPSAAGAEAEYKLIEGDEGREKWICDGRYIYEFDFGQKILYEDQIPQELRGEKIVDSPLPFLFGAKRDDILQRYWIRPIAQNNNDEYWLEAYPKRIEDSRMYSRVEVILAREDFLPKAIHVYSPQYNPAMGNFQSRYFRFENREINQRIARIKDFMGIFVRPQTPPFEGWKRVDRMTMYQEQQAGLPAAAGQQKK